MPIYPQKFIKSYFQLWKFPFLWIRSLYISDAFWKISLGTNYRKKTIQFHAMSCRVYFLKSVIALKMRHKILTIRFSCFPVILNYHCDTFYLGNWPLIVLQKSKTSLSLLRSTHMYLRVTWLVRRRMDFDYDTLGGIGIGNSRC